MAEDEGADEVVEGRSRRSANGDGEGEEAEGILMGADADGADGADGGATGETVEVMTVVVTVEEDHGIC